MGARHSGREAALQLLFALEATSAPLDQTIADFWKSFDADLEGREYAETIVRGVIATRDAIDVRIRAASEHWRLERMSRVDRNLLRIGVWEIENGKDVPRAVIIDEAVELAKAFGAEESSGFVNGVLHKIADVVGR